MKIDESGKMDVDYDFGVKHWENWTEEYLENVSALYYFLPQLAASRGFICLCRK